MSTVELVTAREICRRLDLAATRLRSLRADAPAAFPEPLGRLGRSDVWQWEAVRAWADDQDGRGASAAPLPLPPALPPHAFIGRRAELDELAPTVASERLIVLTGPTGVGKTRLARELWTRSACSYPGGAHFVELGAIEGGSSVAPSISGVVGVTKGTGLPLDAAIAARLGHRRILLVLDNCEHVRESCRELVVSLLEACPGLTIVATSQVTLEVAGERVWPVPPLSLPRSRASAAAVAASDAVSLFAARARAVNPDFRLTEELLAVVATICRRLDGIPLAIELAAARTGFLTPHEMLERLDARLTLLTGPIRATLPRHQALQMAIDWSYCLLSPGEQALLRRLSVFHGGWTLEAAEAICVDNGDSRRMLAELGALVARSLIAADTSKPRTHYRMLESIRLFARERLTECGEAAPLRRRHAIWYLRLAERAEPELSGGEQLSWLGLLDLEHDNIRAALGWAIEEKDAEVALRLGTALVLFWHPRDLDREGREWLGAALGLPATRSARIQARALWGYSYMALMVRDIASLPELLEEGLTCAREAGDLATEGRLLFVLANVTLYSDRGRAIRLLRDAIDRSRRAEDSWCLTNALAVSGSQRELAGEIAAARRDLEEAVSIGHRACDDQSLRVALILAGKSASNHGELASGEALLRDGLARARRVGEAYSIARALEYLATLSLERGDYGESLALVDEALEVGRELGNVRMAAGNICLRGRILHAQARLSEAESLFQQALAEMDRLGVRCGSALHGLGDIALARGALEPARGMLEEVSAMLTDDRAHPEYPAILASLGDLAREDDAHRAMSFHTSALELRHELSHVPSLPGSLEALGSIAIEVGHLPRAVRLLAAGDALRRSVGLARHPIACARYEADVAAARDGLGTDAYQQAWQAGTGTRMAQAVSYALRGSGRRTRDVAGWAGLTRTEHDVVALVSRGLTNAEVGERLFMSPRTVEVHLTHIFGKLGMRSRRELTREALRRAG